MVGRDYACSAFRGFTPRVPDRLHLAREHDAESTGASPTVAPVLFHLRHRWRLDFSDCVVSIGPGCDLHRFPHECSAFVVARFFDLACFTTRAHSVSSHSDMERVRVSVRSRLVGAPRSVAFMSHANVAY